MAPGTTAVHNSSDAKQSASAIAKRRARNRVSQKSHREKKSLYIRELETQLAETSKHDDTRLQAAKDECQQLRQSLLATRKRILGLNTALANVADSIGITLGLASGNGNDPARPINNEIEASENDRRACSPRPTRSPMLEDNHVNAIATHLPISTTDVYDLDTTNTTDMSNSALQSAIEFFPWTTNLPLTGPSASFSVAVTQRMNEESETDNMLEELDRGQTALSRPAELDIVDKLTNLSETEIAHFERAYLHDSRMSFDSFVMSPPGNIGFPSVFSGHLAACEYFIKQSKAYKQRRSKGGSERLSRHISNMVSMFVNTAWPEMRVWWAYMGSSASVERIIRWRLDPSLESFQELFPCHRPTATQLSTLHPSIIDWVFFPNVRDKLIELYSNSWMLDQIVCEQSAACVVEADVSKILLGLPDEMPRQGYFRIWDLVQIISRNETVIGSTMSLSDSAQSAFLSFQDWTATPESPYHIEQDEDSAPWIPMHLDDIFRSRKAALRLFKALKMNDRQKVKLDPAFGIKYPAICDDPSIFATGLDCTDKNSQQVPAPRPLTREVILCYKMMLWKAVA